MKLGITIGRWAANPDALHEGHKHLIRQAATNSDSLLVLVGSANQPRTIRTPWTFQERKNGIEKWLSFPCNENIKNKISIIPINDYAYNDSIWIKQIQAIVNSHRGSNDVILFGHEKEDTDYLTWFPDWGYKSIESNFNTSGTKEREYLFKNKQNLIPPSVMDDWNYFEKEKEIFANYPFPETLNFNCADAILECGGHVLLIKRKIAPGAGTWALPGGFKGKTETFVDCAIRELSEETNVRVAEKVLRGSIVQTKLFDDPKRGHGIPRNTLAVHIKVGVNADGTLPRVSPKDDAVEAVWVKLSEVGSKYQMFDKHDSILVNMGVI